MRHGHMGGDALRGDEILAVADIPDELSAMAPRFLFRAAQSIGESRREPDRL
jgi:hypothetical protein